MPAAREHDRDSAARLRSSHYRGEQCSGESRASATAARSSRLDRSGCDGLARGIQPRDTIRCDRRHGELVSTAAAVPAGVGRHGGSASCAWAGGGPENVLLLVNSNSLNSKTIANHYIALRNIPASQHRLHRLARRTRRLPGRAFSPNKILQPAINAIGERGLSAQIDYVVYSSDFPWRVDLTSLIPDQKFGLPNRPRPRAPAPPICGSSCATRIRRSMSPIVNWYVSPTDGDNYRAVPETEQSGIARLSFELVLGARRRQRTNPTKGQSYLLSTMLGVTTGRGQHRRRNARVSQAIGRSRRNATARHLLLHEEQRRPFADAARLLRRRGRATQAMGVSGSGHAGHPAATARKTCSES